MDNEECNMIQADIFKFGSLQPSATTERVYLVEWDPEKKRFVCKGENGGPGCGHEKKRNEATKQLEPCRHVLKHINGRLLAQKRYLESRKDWKSDTIFRSFEQVMERMMHSNNEEITYICNLALALAYGQEKKMVCSDDVYAVLKGRFETQGIMGISFKLLKDRGYLKFLYYKKSETPTNHGAVIGVYCLTDSGKDIFKGEMM